MKYSLIITAWKEPKTVAETLSRVLNPKYNNYLDGLEIILACPDQDTYESAKRVVDEYNFPDFVFINDPGYGKPFALNLVFEKAVGDILIFTDGDVVLAPDALGALVAKFDSDEVGGVTGRPVSIDTKTTMFGYWGNLLADAAHVVRSRLEAKGGFYFMSGYLYAMKRIEGFSLPTDILIDDAYITTKIIENGKIIQYADQAKVYVKYPRNFSDWIKQKKRSVGGYYQIKDNLPKGIKNRSIIEELKFLFFPLRYATNTKELFYSIMLYPARLTLWIVIFWYRKFGQKSLKKTWVRIESTK